MNTPNNKHAKNQYNGLIEHTHNDHRSFNRAETLTLEDALDTIIILQEKIRLLEYNLQSINPSNQSIQWQLDGLRNIVNEWDNKLFKVIKL